MKTVALRQARRGFTVVEIMIVVATIALIAAIAMPNYVRSRKRSQALRVLDEVKMVQQAIDQYTLEHNRTGSEAIAPGDLPYFLPYIKTGSSLYVSLPNDFLGNPFTLSTLDTPPKISTTTFDALSAIAPADFWSPFNP